MLESLPQIIIAGFFFLFPLFYANTTAESYEYNKQALFIVTTIVLSIILLISVAKHRKITISKTTFALPLFFLAITVVLSTLFSAPNLAVALTTPLSTATIVTGFFFYLILTAFISEENKTFFMLLLVASTVCVALFTLASYSGIIPQNQFSPAGTLLSTAIFLSIISVYLFTTLLVTLRNKRKELISYAGQAVAFLVTGTITILIGIHLFTDQRPIILSHRFGWWILLDIAKNVKTLFLGVGPTNFISAFTLAKPPEMNATPLWNIIFTTSSSFLLTLTSETGIISLILFLSLFLIAANRLKIILQTGDLVSLPLISTLLFALFLQMIMPSSMVVFILTIILLAFSSQQTKIRHISLLRPGPFAWIFISPLLFILLTVLFFTAQFYVAEMSFKSSLDALLNNQGLEAYTYQKDAIALNPWLDRYHLAFSNTSLSLANALVSKKELTDEDKQNIPRLTQQAIEEGKLAVRLYPTNVTNWDNLAKIYVSLINFATGAHSWAIQAYQNRMALDPVNPQAKLTLGGLYFTLKKYDEAEKLFRDAVFLKPDLANAHYNLANTLREQEKYKEASQEYGKTLSLVTSDSQDAVKIREEMKLLPPQE